MKNNKIEVLLHETLHKNYSDKREVDSYFDKSRLDIFPFVEKIIGRQIAGEILDVGAGNGYAGVWLAKNRVTKVTLLECTTEAVESVIPYYVQYFNVLDVCSIQKGTFYDLSKYKDKFDFVVCFGVLHHSNNLLNVMDNIMSILKPNGLLIAQEPYTNDNTNNKDFNDIYNMEEVFAGKAIRHGDRDDHFFRRCEYLTAVHHSGFNIIKVCDVSKLVNQTSFYSYLRRAVFKSLWKIKKEKHRGEVAFADVRSQKLKPKHLLLLCQKPSSYESTVHRWCEGRDYD